MLWLVPANGSEKGFPALSILQVTLAQTETDRSATHVLDLFCESALSTAKHFNQIYLGPHYFCLVLDLIKFLLHHGYQFVEVIPFLITLA